MAMIVCSKLTSRFQKRVSKFLKYKVNWSCVPVSGVTTWNALASSFNLAPQKKYNFWSQNVGLFEISKLDNPEGFKALKVI